jgi:small-conductance mechanosensitive channel
VQSFLTSIIEFLPRLFGAILILIVGGLIALVVRAVVAFALRRVQLDELCRRAGITRLLEQGNIRRSPSQLIAAVIYYAILAFALLTALGALGLTFVTGSLNMLILYTPRVLGALALLILGIAAAGIIAEAAERVLADLGVQRIGGLQTVIRLALIALVAILAAALLGIDVALLIAITVILLSGVALTAALALGLGLRGLSQNIAASRYITEGIDEGDRITVAGASGTVEQVGYAMTTLRADDGRVFLVPNHHFTEHIVEKEPRVEV